MTNLGTTEPIHEGGIEPILAVRLVHLRLGGGMAPGPMITVTEEDDEQNEQNDHDEQAQQSLRPPGHARMLVVAAHGMPYGRLVRKPAEPRGMVPSSIRLSREQRLQFLGRLGDLAGVVPADDRH